jgi:hypothetical protein
MADSGLAGLTAKVYAIVNGVTGTIKVHIGQQLCRDWGQFITQFRDATGSRINGWTVSRSRSEEDHLTNQEMLRKHYWTIRGYYSVTDGSDTEASFQQLVEDVCDAWRVINNLDLSDTCEICFPPQVLTVDYRFFGGVLCHYCEIEVSAQERLAIGGAS